MWRYLVYDIVLRFVDFVTNETYSLFLKMNRCVQICFGVEYIKQKQKSVRFAMRCRKPGSETYFLLLMFRVV